MGIEPTYSAWKAEVLPLNYTRITSTSRAPQSLNNQEYSNLLMVEGGGFEPPKVEPADLQSAPFDRSGIPPKIKPRILLEHNTTVNRNALIRQIFFKLANNTPQQCFFSLYSAYTINKQTQNKNAHSPFILYNWGCGHVMEPVTGVEPTTSSLQVRRSTN